MAQKQELETLRGRKLTLLAQSKANRCSLDEECASLGGVVHGLESGISVFRKMGPLLVLISPLAGFVAATRWRKLSSLTRNIAVGWQVIHAISSAWRHSGTNDR